MRIHLIDDYYCVKGDASLNLVQRKVVQEGKNKGKERLEVIGYLPNFEKVLRLLGEMLQYDRLEGAKELKDAVRIVKQSNEEVKQLIDKTVGYEG